MQAVVKSLIRTAGIVAVTLAAPFSAHAGDAPGCKDPAGLKRFDGSRLVQCEQRDFAEYALPLGKLTAWNYDTKTAAFESKLDVEGRASFNIYFVPKGPSSAEVARNYELDLAAKGFEVLFAAKGSEFGFDQGRVFEHMGPGEQLFGYSPENARYISAKKEENGRQTYISLYVIQYAGGIHSKLRGEVGQVMVRLDTIVSGALEDRMTVVTANQMQKSIDETGRVTLYGILFDFNKSDLKPESRPALDEIAKYLRAHPARRLHVVGHTDSVGGFDFNVRLSEQRARAVVAELIRGYGIEPARLRGNGVGLLAPIATNETDDGRAKNRRVELVPM